MKALVFAFATALSATSVLAQSGDDPAATVKAMFAGMSAKDTSAIRATLHPVVRLFGTATVDGAPAYRAGTMDGWVRGAGRATSNNEERTFDHQTRIDGNLATVWTPYEFYREGNFSHCGIDAYQLVKLGGKWLIISASDTGRRTLEDCGKSATPKVIPPPPSADTAAVIAAVQSLFDAMAAADTTAAKAAFIPEGVIGGLAPRMQPSFASRLRRNGPHRSRASAPRASSSKRMYRAPKCASVTTSPRCGRTTTFTLATVSRTAESTRRTWCVLRQAGRSPPSATRPALPGASNRSERSRRGHPQPNAQIEVREYAAPELEPDSALLHVELSEVCGTDVHLRAGRLTGVPYPLIPGHVTVGRLEQIRGELRSL